jgi:phosphoglycolate phosphatase-like HAD superfamily hydrolase
MNIAFDLDGTLISCAQRQSAVLQSIVNALTLDCDIQRVWECKRAGGSTEAALVQSGITATSASQIAAQWKRVIEEPYWLSLDSLFDGSKDLLKKLKHQGHRLQLLTARSRADLVVMQLNQLGISDLFDQVDVVSTQKVQERKSEQLRLRAAQVFIGDTESDFQAARLAGLPFYAVATGQRSAAFLHAQGIARVSADLHDALSRINE